VFDADGPQLNFFSIVPACGFGGLGMSFNICRGTLGNLAMFTARIFAGWPLGQLRNQAVTTGAQTAAYCSAIVAESV
jgi:hypothetical protein